MDGWMTKGLKRYSWRDVVMHAHALYIPKRLDKVDKAEI